MHLIQRRRRGAVIQCSAVQCSVKLTLLSGQGALVAVDSMRRKKSQYSSHVLSADRYWLLVPSGQHCLQNRCCSYPDKSMKNSMLTMAM